MGVYVEYCKWLNMWHVFGSLIDQFYDTEEEARKVQDELVANIVKEHNKWNP